MRTSLLLSILFLSITLSAQFLPSNPFFPLPIKTQGGSGNSLSVIDASFNDTLILNHAHISHASGFSSYSSVLVITKDSLKTASINTDYTPITWHSTGAVTTYLSKGHFVSFYGAELKYQNVFNNTTVIVKENKRIPASLQLFETLNSIYYLNFSDDTIGYVLPPFYAKDSIYLMAFDKQTYQSNTVSVFTLPKRQEQVPSFTVDGQANELKLYFGAYNNSLDYYLRYTLSSGSFVDTVTYQKTKLLPYYPPYVRNNSNDSIYRITRDSVGVKTDSVGLYYDTAGETMISFINLKDFSTIKNDFYVYGYEKKVGASGTEKATFRTVKLNANEQVIFDEAFNDTLFDHHYITGFAEISSGILLFARGKFGYIGYGGPEPRNAFILHLDTNGRLINTLDLERHSVAKSKLQVFPNPVKEKLTLQNNDTESFEYILFYLDGKEALRGSIEKNSTHYINTSTLPKGMYLLHMVSATGVHFSKKIVVQ